MIWILVAAYVIAAVFAVAFVAVAGRRPWWEQMNEDLDALPTTEEGPGDQPETLSPDDHETR